MAKSRQPGFTEKDLSVVHDLCLMAWASGVAKTPEMARELLAVQDKVRTALGDDRIKKLEAKKAEERAKRSAPR